MAGLRRRAPLTLSSTSPRTMRRSPAHARARRAGKRRRRARTRSRQRASGIAEVGGRAALVLPHQQKLCPVAYGITRLPDVARRAAAVNRRSEPAIPPARPRRRPPHQANDPFPPRRHRAHRRCEACMPQARTAPALTAPSWPPSVVRTTLVPHAASPACHPSRRVDSCRCMADNTIEVRIL